MQRLRFTVGILVTLVAVLGRPARAQQYNSDNYLSKPHGVMTIILTAGERNIMWMSTFSLFPRWEFTAAAYLYNDDDDPTTNDGHSTSYYFKYMFYENKAKTGGFALKGGTGMDPGYLDGDDRVNDATQTWWMNMPVTLPLFDNKVSWDIMPGWSVTRHYGADEQTATALTYSTRVAWYPSSPVLAVVGEVFGAAGKAEATPEYRVGLRWEPSVYGTFALTYGDEFDGTHGAGLEIGAMIFTPPFACIGGGCK